MSYGRIPKSKYSVYFAASETFGMVKIGCSTKSAERLSQVGAWVPFKIYLGAMTKGGFDLETHFHALFADSWSHLEWFFLTKDIVDVMDRINQGEVFKPTLGAKNTEKEIQKTLKKNASRKVTLIEDKVYPKLQWPDRVRLRPKYLVDAMDSYIGAGKETPTENALAAIDTYVSEMTAKLENIEGLAA